MAKRRPAIPAKRGTRTGRNTTRKASVAVAKAPKAKKAPREAWNFTKVAVDFIEQSTEAGYGRRTSMGENVWAKRQNSEAIYVNMLVLISLLLATTSKNAAICGAPWSLNMYNLPPSVIR